MANAKDITSDARRSAHLKFFSYMKVFASVRDKTDITQYYTVLLNDIIEVEGGREKMSLLYLSKI